MSDILYVTFPEIIKPDVDGIYHHNGSQDITSMAQLCISNYKLIA